MTGHTGTPRRSSAEGRDFRTQLKAFKKTIGGNIVRLRKSQNMPLAILSKRTGFSAARLDYWEMGRQNIDLVAIIRIARALKVPQEMLLGVPGPDRP